MSQPSSAPRLLIAFGSATDIGKRRTNNEDSARCCVLAEGTPEESTLLIVSDGVGGSNSGEVASKLVIDTLPGLLSEAAIDSSQPGDRGRVLDEALREVDLRIREAGNEPNLSGMGATASVLWIAGHEGYWGQAGDSRIYLLRAGVLTQISHDQSPVGRLRASGQLSETEARAHPYRHLIDQCLGGTGATIEPEVGKIEVEAGDVFLLCSDGLSDGLWDHEIGEGLKRATDNNDPEAVANVLVGQANEASGKDNITAVVARAQYPEGVKSDESSPDTVRRVLDALGLADDPPSESSRA